MQDRAQVCTKPGQVFDCADLQQSDMAGEDAACMLAAAVRSHWAAQTGTPSPATIKIVASQPARIALKPMS